MKIMFEAGNVYEAVRVKDSLASVNGVSSINWLDDIVDITVPIALLDDSLVASYYKNGFALVSLTVDEANSSETLESIRSIVGDDAIISGSLVDSSALKSFVTRETTLAMALLLPVILIILLISSNSWLEPLLYFFTIGVSVLINMGTNAFLKDVSFITQTVSPILQIAVSLDYAVFLLKRFREARRGSESDTEAMRIAIKQSFTSVSSSAMTTIFGFLALTFMKFTIGADLGANLLKGIIISFVSVMVFLPALTLTCMPLLDKTDKHKPEGNKTKSGAFAYALRWLALPLVLLVLVPAYKAQSRNSFTYGMPEGASHAQSVLIEERFGAARPLILLYPADRPGAEKLMSDEIARVAGVTQVVSYSTMVGERIPTIMLDEDSLAVFESNGIRRMIIYGDTVKESDKAYNMVENIREIASAYYGGESYLTGEDANLYDMRNVINADTKVVNLIAIAAIAFVLLLAFRSLSLGFIVVLAIEAAIWINLAVPYVMGQSLIYMGYLVIGTVQLGATVDYAILLTDKYLGARRSMPKPAAIMAAISSSAGSILISALVLTVAGFALFATSSNSIVSGMGMLLARGTILSFMTVLLFLPGMLCVFDPVIRVTTFRSRFFGSAKESVKQTIIKETIEKETIETTTETKTEIKTETKIIEKTETVEPENIEPKIAEPENIEPKAAEPEIITAEAVEAKPIETKTDETKTDEIITGKNGGENL